MANRYRLLPLSELLMRHVRVADSGCWEWTGHTYPNGYGQFHKRRKVCYAHRVSYEIHKGEIERGLVLDHLCRNRGCVNPAHLEAVAHRTNVRRGNAVKSACRNGHPYTQQDTYRDKNGWPHCRICQNEQRRNKRMRTKNYPEAIRNVAD